MLLACLCLLLVATGVNAEEGSGTLQMISNDEIEGSGILLGNSTAEVEGSGMEAESAFSATDFAKIFTGTLMKGLMGMFGGNEKYEKPTNGKLIHDMRTFVNVTFDWSSPPNDENVTVAIPQCHEERIRKSYYQLHMGISALVASATTIMDARTGHLVYPLKMTVVNASDVEPTKVYYAAGVHRMFAYQDQDQFQETMRKEKLVEIVMVSEKTWQLIWNRWKTANKEGVDLCDGGRHFDRLIKRIKIEKGRQPPYETIIQSYTDLTSDVCGPESCDCPLSSAETLTFAYPTEEGLAQNVTSSVFGTQISKPMGNSTLLLQAANNSKMRDIVFDACYNKRFNAGMKESMRHAKEQFKKNHNDTELEYVKFLFTDDSETIKENQCIFYPPYC